MFLLVDGGERVPYLYISLSIYVYIHIYIYMCIFSSSSMLELVAIPLAPKYDSALSLTLKHSFPSLCV